MSKTSRLAFYDGSVQGWERALYAFLGEKERRSGSQRTALSIDRPYRRSGVRLLGGGHHAVTRDWSQIPTSRHANGCAVM